MISFSFSMFPIHNFVWCISCGRLTPQRGRKLFNAFRCDEQMSIDHEPHKTLKVILQCVKKEIFGNIFDSFKMLEFATLPLIFPEKIRSITSRFVWIEVQKWVKRNVLILSVWKDRQFNRYGFRVKFVTKLVHFTQRKIPHDESHTIV